MYNRFIKRFFDFTIAFLVIISISWILIIIAIWLYIVNKGTSVLFFQERPGKRGKMFKVIKFKSMTDERDTEGNLLPNDQRITNIGNFIRKYSIDELPQLFNVLKGDMSLIGPRPLMPRYLHLYSSEQMRRHEVRPGITGWAQVNGRNNITWTEKFKLDVWYVDHCNLWLDIKILWMTVIKVLAGNDTRYEGSSVNSEGFNGHN
ncbi:sugar transferase [Bacteroidales bacterium MB20-C3-3]|nr:sugar transferase [Bacteroidales bacterium MB20-C3-3]